MVDDLEHLRNNPQQLQLFCHYARLGESNRETWQLRLSVMEEVRPSELARLHGELIALDWVEQNTGRTPCCYRITLAGLRAFRQLQTLDSQEAPLLEMDEVGNQAA
jgi:hypothetical protein